MDSRIFRRFRAVAALAAAAILAACSGGAGGSLLPSGHTGGGSNGSQSAFISPPAAGSAPDTTEFFYHASPPTQLFKNMSVAHPAALPPPSVCVADFGLACYTPQLIRTAYNVPSNLDGTGETIVIVDAFGSPTIQQDLAIFDNFFGLPNPVLNIFFPSGQPTINQNDPNIQGWESETSLDVEWAHAIAPRATIDLVVAQTNSSSNLHAAEQFAIEKRLGDVMSMSFGAPEHAISGGANNAHFQHADNLYQQARKAQMTLFASAGDTGATNGLSAPSALFPASDPLITAVGGTNLFISDSGQYQNETVWNDTDPNLCPFGCIFGPFGATGGAPSMLFNAPSYQHELLHQSARTTADVSYDASVYTAVLVVESFDTPQPELFFVGGTSAGAPQWAGIIALADEAAGHSLGFINADLYKFAHDGLSSSVFHDVTVGENGLFGGPGFSAGAGYDLPTGLGTPNVANLIDALAGHAR